MMTINIIEVAIIDVYKNVYFNYLIYQGHKPLKDYLWTTQKRDFLVDSLCHTLLMSIAFLCTFITPFIMLQCLKLTTEVGRLSRTNEITSDTLMDETRPFTVIVPVYPLRPSGPLKITLGNQYWLSGSRKR